MGRPARCASRSFCLRGAGGAAPPARSRGCEVTFPRAATRGALAPPPPPDSLEGFVVRGREGPWPQRARLPVSCASVRADSGCPATFSFGGPPRESWGAPLSLRYFHAGMKEAGEPGARGGRGNAALPVASPSGTPRVRLARDRRSRGLGCVWPLLLRMCWVFIFSSP